MKLDALIRKGTKLAMGLPITTSTHRLLDMGYHNTVYELVAIHKRRQEIRLLLTSQGRHILTQLGHNVPSSPPPKEAALPTTTHANTTDTATAIAVTDYHFSRIHTAVLPPMDPCLAELHAIAAAITYTSSGSFTSSIPIIFTDSMADCRRLIHNSLPLAIAEQIELDLVSHVEVVWIPGHGGCRATKKHTCSPAKRFIGHPTFPDLPRRFPHIDEPVESFPPFTLNSRHQGTILRNAQSNTLPTPARIHLLRGLLPEDPPPASTWLTTATTLADQVYLAASIQSSLEYATRGGLD
ncbi:hypothetical protein HPB47_012963 [Ixodes persulcatus]|uniref:Uncharacterized protein n=1 Tax=Ixodes persulcatus TaxID=34615 RepID=A0AC60NS30_IXOPE|nr:hypothetical protein HPB47_012963 [Ixodes persulcatus]